MQEFNAPDDVNLLYLNGIISLDGIITHILNEYSM